MQSIVLIFIEIIKCIIIFYAILCTTYKNFIPMSSMMKNLNQKTWN